MPQLSLATAGGELKPTDSILEQVASFMGELEASGLLKDEQAPVAAVAAAEQPVTQPVTDQPPAEAGPAAEPFSTIEDSAAPASSPVATAAAAAAEPAAAQPEMPGTLSVAEGGEESAEQRVLGALQGAPGWQEVPPLLAL